jgi:hypothetical protein
MNAHILLLEDSDMACLPDHIVAQFPTLLIVIFTLFATIIAYLYKAGAADIVVGLIENILSIRIQEADGIAPFFCRRGWRAFVFPSI